jgi:hypothetical protein
LSLLRSSNKLERKLFTGGAMLLQRGDDLACVGPTALGVGLQRWGYIESSVTRQRGSCEVPLSASGLGLLGGAQCGLVGG